MSTRLDLPAITRGVCELRDVCNCDPGPEFPYDKAREKNAALVELLRGRDPDECPELSRSARIAIRQLWCLLDRSFNANPPPAERAETLSGILAALEGGQQAPSQAGNSSLPKPPTLPTIWFHDRQSYSLDQVTPRNVRTELHRVLQRFLDKDCALTTKELESAANNVAKAIGEIERLFPGPVYRPTKGKKGGGYFIRVRSLPAK